MPAPPLSRGSIALRYVHTDAIMRIVVDDKQSQGSGAENDGHLRASARMITTLARQKLWTDSLADEHRATLVQKLTDALAVARTPREAIAISKALAALERADIDRARLMLDAEKTGQEDTAQTQARRIRAALDEMDALEG